MIIGADIGTQSPKRSSSHPIWKPGRACGRLSAAFSRAGWAEQDLAEWERALRWRDRRGACRGGRDAREVEALGLTGQLDGAIATGGDGLPLHPCLIWPDRRAEAEIARIDADLVRGFTGVICDATHLGAKIRWLKAHVGAARRATRFHVPVSFMVSRLTGSAVVDHATASTSMVYGLASQRYIRSFSTCSRSRRDAGGRRG